MRVVAAPDPQMLCVFFLSSRKKKAKRVASPRRQPQHGATPAAQALVDAQRA
jgi:hypothetical protein